MKVLTPSAYNHKIHICKITGASFVTRAEKVYVESFTALEDNQIHASYLNPTRASFRMYKFMVPENSPQVFVALQSCTGYIRLHLYKNGEDYSD